MTRPVDAHGRTVVAAMSEREMQEEILLTMRALADQLADLGKNPLLASMVPALANGIRRG
jgi:hypothetical protein